MRLGLKAVALIEAFKGAIALIIGLELHKLNGQNLQTAFDSLASHLHLNPAKGFPGVIAHELASLSVSNLTLIASGAVVYAGIRLIEAYGLWHEVEWTEWFAVVSGTIYIPFEVYESIAHTSLIGAIALAINMSTVWYVYSIVRHNRIHQTIAKV